MADKFGRGSEILDALKAMTLSAPYSGSGGSSSGATIAGTGLANTIPYWNDVATLGYIANAAGYLSNDGAGAFSWVATPPPAAHNILSASHGDTTAAVIQRGDLLTGQGASPHLARLGKESQYTFLGMGANEPAWSTGLLIWPTPASMSALLTGSDLSGVRYSGGPAANSLELHWGGYSSVFTLNGTMTLAAATGGGNIEFISSTLATVYIQSGNPSYWPLGISVESGGHYCGITGHGQFHFPATAVTDLDIGLYSSGGLDLGGHIVTVTADCSIPGGVGGLTQAQALALVCLRG